MSARNVCVLFFYEDSAQTRVRFFDLMKMGISSNISDMKLSQALEIALEEKNLSGAIDRVYVDHCNRTVKSEITPPCHVDASVTLYVIEKKDK